MKLGVSLLLDAFVLSALICSNTGIFECTSMDAPRVVGSLWGRFCVEEKRLFLEVGLAELG